MALYCTRFIRQLLFLITLVLSFSGCYWFGAELTSLGYKTRTENTLHDCSQLCNDNVGCHLFQWNQNKNECRLFAQAVLNENEIFSKEANSVISIPDCNDEKVKWLKNTFEIPTITTTTTTTIESINTLTEENEQFKYGFFKSQV